MPQALTYPVFRTGLVFISSTFYGGFLVLFAVSLLILHQQHKKNGSTQASSTNIYFTFSYLMMAVLTTVFALSAAMNFNQKLTEIKDVGSYSPLMLIQHIIGYLANVIGDSVMVYRLYVISCHKRIVLLTAIFILFCGLGLTLAVIFSYVLRHVFFVTGNIILVGMSLSVNIVATLLIARNVWKQQALTRAVGGGEIINRLLAIFIESCALYTIWMVAFIIAHFTSNPLSQVFLYGSPHISGIASMLITVRVGLGWAVREERRFARPSGDSPLTNSRLSHAFFPPAPWRDINQGGGPG